MDNETEKCSNLPPNLDEMLNIYARIGIMALATLILIFTAVSLFALNRTRHTPKTARFLASGLLVFDSGTTLTYTVRKLVSEPGFNRYINILGTGWSLLAYLQIGTMCVERLLVFQWPNFYLRSVSFKKVRVICLLVWLSYFVAWIVATGRCTFIYCTDEADECFNESIIGFVMVICPASVLVSSISLIKIASLIRKQKAKFQNSPSVIRNYKSTFVVFLCFINYIFTTLVYGILAGTVKGNLERRIVMDGLMTVNGLLDTLVYVLWYKECRLEFIKMASKTFPSLNKKIDKMKLSIFDIVTSTTSY